MTEKIFLSDKQFNYLFFFLFFLLSIFGITVHEVWLDEAHHWLLARDSKSIADVLYNTRYDGHPLLWTFMLYFLSFFSKNVVIMQLLHVAVSGAACLLLLKHAPFRRMQKVLIIFSYYFFFEYNLISRNYALAWLLLVVLCILFTGKTRNDLYIAVVLFLLANTHLFALVCTIPFIIILFYDRLKNKKRIAGTIALGLICAAGLALAFVQMNPPADSYMKHLSFNSDFFNKEKLNRFGGFFTKSLFYLPDFTSYNFWNSHFFFSVFKTGGYIISILSLLVPFFCFRNKISFFIFYIAAGGIATALFVMPLNAVHYLGFCFMIFLVSLWIDRAQPRGSVNNPSLRIKTGEVLLYAMLALQAFGGIVAYYKDTRYPFSEGRTVAKYLSEKHVTTEVKIISMNAGTSVAAYLQNKLYYPEENRWATFHTWNSSYLRDPLKISERVIRQLDSLQGSKVAVVIGDWGAQSDSLVQLIRRYLPDTHTERKFYNGIVKGENYTILEN